MDSICAKNERMELNKLQLMPEVLNEGKEVKWNSANMTDECVKGDKLGCRLLNGKNY